ncbi:uncharacterized protein LOC130590291 [Beta vulgaris subsp. vulgaris]|uniref:uncharacterized protein LOC130590291 n=1 Tax=Beta vulgaris subsp. vulgaris TaxID=3555 RepID=UPI0025493E95|nr:uncharacterized protein LOC130590291 [Beta vulgaris subsp. vulgaris]
MSIKQGETESLRDYVGRFNAEAVTIPTLQQEVAVLALMTGLKEGTPFRSYLGRKKMTCLTEVLGKANDFIRGEEFDKAANAKRPVAIEKEKEKDKDKDRRDDKYRRDKKAESTGRKEESNSVKKGFEGRPDKYNNYTPLTISRARIFELHSKDDKWQRPRKMYYKGRDKSKWCEFHDDYGHKTDDCKDLKDGIEDLVRRGYFTQYLSRNDRKTPPREDDNGNRRPVKDRITEIHTSVEDQLEAVVFTERKPASKSPAPDFQRDGSRVLVDGGSSANILYKETFEKMGFDETCLKPVSYPVIGFTGASVVPEGQ